MIPANYDTKDEYVKIPALGNDRVGKMWRISMIDLLPPPGLVGFGGETLLLALHSLPKAIEFNISKPSTQFCALATHSIGCHELIWQQRF